MTQALPDQSTKSQACHATELAVVKATVCLTVAQDRFKAGSTMPGRVNGGWPRVLSGLKSFLETGQGLAAAKGG